MNPLFSPTAELGAKGDAKWWTSCRCMFDSQQIVQRWALVVTESVV